MNRVEGVFLWRAPERPAIVIHGDHPCIVTYCVAISGRPQWWQIRRRWRLLRTIERMPDGRIEIAGPSGFTRGDASLVGGVIALLPPETP